MAWLFDKLLDYWKMVLKFHSSCKLDCWDLELPTQFGSIISCVFDCWDSVVSAFGVTRMCCIVASRCWLLPPEGPASTIRSTSNSRHRACHLQECVGLLKIGRRPCQNIQESVWLFRVAPVRFLFIFAPSSKKIGCMYSFMTDFLIVLFFRSDFALLSDNVLDCWKTVVEFFSCLVFIHTDWMHDDSSTPFSLTTASHRLRLYLSGPDIFAEIIKYSWSQSLVCSLWLQSFYRHCDSGWIQVFGTHPPITLYVWLSVISIWSFGASRLE